MYDSAQKEVCRVKYAGSLCIAKPGSGHGMNSNQ